MSMIQVCSCNFQPISGPDRRRNGYTIMELMVAVVVAGLIAAIALPAYTGAMLKARNSVASGDLARIDGALERFRSNGALPATLGELNMGALNDPWGRPYQYLNIEAGVDRSLVRKNRNLAPLNTDYDLYSMGKDGTSKSSLRARASRDDVIRAGNGGFIGPADDF